MSSSRNRNQARLTKILELLTARVVEAEKALHKALFMKSSEEKAYSHAIDELASQLNRIVGRLFIESNPAQIVDAIYQGEALSKLANKFTSSSEKIKFIVIQDIKASKNPDRTYAYWIDVLRHCNVEKYHYLSFSIISAILEFSKHQLEEYKITPKEYDVSIISELSSRLCYPASMMKDFRELSSVPQMSIVIGEIVRLKESTQLTLENEQTGEKEAICDETIALARIDGIKSRLDQIVREEKVRLGEMHADDCEVFSALKRLNVDVLSEPCSEVASSSSSPSASSSKSSPVLLRKHVPVDSLTLHQVRRSKTSGHLELGSSAVSSPRKQKKLALSQELIEAPILQPSSSLPTESLLVGNETPPRRTRKSSFKHTSSSGSQGSVGISVDTSKVSGRRSRKNSSPDQNRSPIKSPYKRVCRQAGSTAPLLDRSASATSVAVCEGFMPETSQSLPSLNLNVLALPPVQEEVRKSKSRKRVHGTSFSSVSTLGSDVASSSAPILLDQDRLDQDAANVAPTPSLSSLRNRISFFERVSAPQAEEEHLSSPRGQIVRDHINQKVREGKKQAIEDTRSLSRLRSQTSYGVNGKLFVSPVKHIKRSSSEANMRRAKKN